MAAAAKKLTIEPANATIYLQHSDPSKTKQRFTAKNETGTDVTTSATWAANDPAIATVHAGLATPIKPGTAKITATAEGVTSDPPATLEVLCRINTQYRQDVGWWANEYYAYHKYDNPLLVKPAGTIAAVGCALTSSAMAISSAGNVIDPGYLDRYMTQAQTPKYRFYDKWNGVKFDPTIPFFSDHKIKEVVGISFIQNDWQAELDKCNVIIANLGRHYVLVIGYRNGQFITYDPLRDGERLINPSQIKNGLLCKF